MIPPPSYDSNQLAAVKIRCVICQKEYFMTAPHPVCLRCRQGKK